MIEKHCADLLAGYCLDALDPAEREQVAAHLEVCPDCCNEAASLAECLHVALGHNCPPATPDPLVRTRFLARVALELMPAEKESAPPQPAEPPIVRQEALPPTPVAKRRPFIARWVIAAVAVPTIVAIVFAVGWANMMQRYNDQHNNLLSQALSAPHVAMVLNGPAAKQGMTGEVIVPKSGNGGLLIISGLNTAPPANMHYMCWLQKGGRWKAWGPLTPDSSGLAMFVMHDSTDPHHATVLAITLEHAGSSPTKPSAPMLLSTTL